MTRNASFGILWGMKVYPSVPVTLSYQNLGSVWLGILRGATESIELVFNGLYNLRATNGSHEFHDHTQTVSTFWTNRRAMRRFFFNQFYLPRETGGRGQGRLIRTAMRHAQASLAELRNHSEGFMRFNRIHEPDNYGSGTITAERPDNDMKDSILSHAFSENAGEKSVESL